MSDLVGVVDNKIRFDSNLNIKTDVTFPKQNLSKYWWCDAIRMYTKLENQKGAIEYSIQHATQQFLIELYLRYSIIIDHGKLVMIRPTQSFLTA